MIICSLSNVTCKRKFMPLTKVLIQSLQTDDLPNPNMLHKREILGHAAQLSVGSKWSDRFRQSQT